ncbi:MAG: hypothetical protein M9920_11750 [Verrucomicrobiae bacterium]|nr:hypothetical protein [Verrucomicrobiae bacterium]
MSKTNFSKQMKINSQNMPPLRGLNLLGAGFYKDVAPTALGIGRAQVSGETVIQKNYDELPAP